MHLKRLLTGVFTAAILASPALAAEQDSLRLRLIESASAETVYTIDEHSTLATSTAPGALAGELEGFCTKKGGTLERLDDGTAPDRLSVKCGSLFEAKALEGKLVNGRPVFLVKNSASEPFAFKNPDFPAIDRLGTPADGRLPGSYSSLDVYQYMYALCKKGNGTPSTVITRRQGKSVRLGEATDAEAFDYILNSGDGRDPWYMECAGEKKFLIEKDYRYSNDQENVFYYHTNRGLDGINYVKLETDKVAKLEGSDSMLDDAGRADFADFLKMSGLDPYAAKFK
ncbi:MAG: hypothetical protein ACE5GY_02300 [Thermodesulfobacteriota bacterium]